MSAFINVLQYWPLLLSGLAVTVVLAVISIVGGMALGILAGSGLVSNSHIVRVIASVYTSIFRGSPLLIQLFMIYLGLAYLGVNMSVYTAAGIGFVLYTGAYVAEIIRAGVNALEVGQFEAAESLAFNRFTTMVRVILPQVLKNSAPTLASFLLGVVKDTSLASILGFVDLTQQGQAIIALTNEPFQTLLVVAVLYFVICFPISRFADRLDRKVAA
ncbi:amino acid ABC transporter permease [Bifidobacterium psychraerophilum]|uniref:amino acid ABC transporter permease n=1 Tax=Bifidobacterium psychraerophilum TaxID=218140 RepID=UPI0039EC3FDF